jgi:hypothetical protein
MSVATRIFDILKDVYAQLDLKATYTYVDEHSGTLTAEQILTALKTVDGAASGLDSDLLDAQHGAYYLSRANHTGTMSADAITDGTTNKAYTATEKTKLAGVAESANNYTHPATHSADIITDGTTNKAYTATEKTKLSGIETGATTDQTAAEILTAIKTVDGTGSGLDSDTLDSYHETDFPRLVDKGSTSVSYSGFDGTEYYEKYSTGKLVKYGTLTIASLGITTSRGSGAYYTTSDLSFTWNTNNPAFTTLPCVEISAKNNTYFTWSMKNISSLLAVAWNLCAVFSVSARAFEISYYAVGRWN